jgi:hypothetical protein
MRCIIAGSRTAPAREVLLGISSCLWLASITRVLTGADPIGEAWARQKGIPVEAYPANWAKFGRRAGTRRNVEMAENADALIAIWDGASRGTLHMITLVERVGLRAHIHKYVRV